MNEIEQSTTLNLDFDKLKKICSNMEKSDVIPTAVQDIETKEVLIIAYVNKKALEYTFNNNVAAFWSTSRNELWIKGATSGNTLKVEEIRVNCEQNSLLYLVKPKNGACHTKDNFGRHRKSCYYRRINTSQKNLQFIN